MPKTDEAKALESIAQGMRALNENLTEIAKGVVRLEKTLESFKDTLPKED